MLESLWGGGEKKNPKVDASEFQGAIDDDIDTEQEFEVTPEELTSIRAKLESGYPADFKYFSDDYILSVASKPYSKDTSIRRPLEYTTEKLEAVLKWRQGAFAPEMEDRIKLSNGPPTATEAVEDPEKFAKCQNLAKSLNYGSMYWHGLDVDGRPVLWIRTNRMPWYPDVEAQVNALMVLADVGISLMPKGVTDFVVLSDSNSPPPPNPQFMISLLKALVMGYPDRLGSLTSCPVGSIIQFVMKLLIPLMPGRLASKINLIGSEDATEKLTKILLKGENDIPTFLGGKCDHDKLYPTETNCSNKGQGNLVFDYFGMVERLEASVKEFEDSRE